MALPMVLNLTVLESANLQLGYYCQGTLWNGNKYPVIVHLMYACVSQGACLCVCLSILQVFLIIIIIIQAIGYYVWSLCHQISEVGYILWV